MWFLKRRSKKASSYQNSSPSRVVDFDEIDLLQSNLDQNIQTIKNKLGKSADIIIREIRIGKEESIKANIIYTDGLTDTPSLQNFILETLMIDIKLIDLQIETSPEKKLISVLKDLIMTVGEIKEISKFDVLFTSLLSGDTIILIDGYAQGLVVPNRQWAQRGITEPTTQTVIRGPREGFTENLRVNTALIRRKLKDPNLWMESMIIGKRTQTDVVIVYINDIANDKIVKEVRSRLEPINIDGILESGYIEELIQDSPYSPFPTVYNTERPDVVAAALLEGRIAILIDGTPFVLLVPALFVQFFQSPEDYYERSVIGSLVRILRFIAFAVSLFTPALFIAITNFHQTMIPPPLLISLAAQREDVPFPTFVEAFLMVITFEILREASIRMPRSIGSAMSIVGAFVIGTAAVEAGVISAMMVIIISITAITNFVSPSYEMAISVRVLRLIFIALAASFGLLGITVGLFALVLHLSSLRSFGVPYLSPIAPFNFSDQKDTFVVLPIWKMLTRPRLLSQKDRIRQLDSNPSKPVPTRNKKKERI